LLLLACSAAFAQTSASNNSNEVQTQIGDDVLANAKQIYVQEGATKALPLYEKALELFKQEGNRKGEAITIGYMGTLSKSWANMRRRLNILNAR